MRYNIYSIDVWGGEEEGTWIENNYFHIGVIDIENDSDKRIIEQLIDEGYLKPTAERFVEIADHSDEYWIYVRQKEDGYPLFNLHRQAE